MKRITILIALCLASISCSQYAAENLKGYIEYGIESDNYVRWAKDQQLTWDLFNGDIDGEGAVYHYFGLYFFYDMADGLKFNATIYFDRNKSWVRPKEEWGAFAQYYDQAPKLLKLQFDFYELTIREMRKFLVENKNTLTDEVEIRELGAQYYDKAQAEWNKIQEELDYDFSDGKLDLVRQMIDSKLDELQEFDTRVNSTF
jgi:hypothetical protein